MIDQNGDGVGGGSEDRFTREIQLQSPDLRVETVNGPFTAFSSQSANVSWTVQNGGNLVPDGYDGTILARFQYQFLNYKKFEEFTFTWNPGGASSNALMALGGSIDTTQVQSFNANAPENICFGIEPLSPGSLTDYGIISPFPIARRFIPP